MVSNNESGFRKVLLVLLSKSRDLQGHSLVGYHLRQRYGYEVEICTVRDVESKLFMYAPDAVVIPVTGGLVLPVSGVSIAQLAKGLGMKVIVLPDAGFFGAEPENVEARRVANAPAGDTTVDCYLAWGNRGRDTLIQQGLASYDQVQTVGCPRFDFYSEPYLSLIPPREEFLSRLGIRNSKSPLVLWNTSTTHVGRDQRESVDRMGFLWKYSETEAWKQLEDENTQFRGQSAALLELARRHPDWNFILRPHPGELIDQYASMIEEPPNIYLGQRGPIQEFLYHCDVLLQRSCTTATEAWMFGKPVIELELGHYHYAVGEEYLSGNDVARSVDQVDDVIQRYISGCSIPESQRRARQAFIDDIYFRIDGRAGERCAAVIHKWISPPSHTDTDHDKMIEAVEQNRQWMRAASAGLSQNLKRFLRLPEDVSLRFWKRRPFRKPPAGQGIAPDVVMDFYRSFDEAIKMGAAG